MQAHASRGHGGLTAGVAGTNDDDVKLFGKLRHSSILA
jgi:hypothetical protein